MNSPPLLQDLTEGATTVSIYEKKRSVKGPATRDALPFYNPSMALNRDTSILIAQHLINTSNQKVHFLDALGASGIRGIRFGNELKGDFCVTVNDISPTSYKLIQHNIRKNQLQNVHAINANIHELLATQHYHYIDIDPFGSPVRYLDGAIRSIKHRGYLAVTATDTAALCGVYPKVCRRRYYSQPFHSPMMHEVGLRILIATVAREAGKYEKGIVPLLCYYSDHYFRCYIQILNSKEKATWSISQIKNVDLDFFSFKPTGKPQLKGPLWIAPLHQHSTLKTIYKDSATYTLDSSSKLQKLFPLWIEESQAPPFHYSTDILAKNHSCDPPKIEKFKPFFVEDGYHFSRTHFGGSTFSTDAPYDTIVALLNKYHRKQQKQEGK